MLLILAMMLVCAAPASGVTRVPARCSDRPAPLLCSISFHRARADRLRHRMALAPLPYARQGEHHPAWRPRILRHWRHAHAHALHAWHHYQAAPWLHGSWLSAALCVHHYEGAWNANTGNGYYGGLQFDLGTWAANGGTGRPDQASPSEQLRVAYLTWQARGWTPWPATSTMCGL